MLTLSLLAAGCGDEADSAEGEGGGPPGGGGPPMALVRTGAIEMQTVLETRRVTGNLRAKQRSQVATIEPGRVQSIAFDEAQEVTAGDVLLVLDGRRLSEDRAEAEADLATAEARVAEEQAELERVRSDLQSREAAAGRAAGAVSEIDLRQGRTAVSVAEAKVEAVQKQVAAVQTRLGRLDVREDDLTIRAPFDGRILMRMVEVGEYLQSGDAVAVLASTGTYEAVLDAPESLSASAVRDASPEAFLISVDATGQVLVPDSIRVVEDVDPRSRRYLVIADVTPPEGTNLTPGSSVTARLPAGAEAPRLVVPNDAIRRGTNGTFIYLALGDGEGPPAAVPSFIEVLYVQDGMAVLATPPAGPLQPGTQLVVQGGERVLFAGQSLKEAPATGESDASEMQPAAPATQPEGGVQ